MLAGAVLLGHPTPGREAARAAAAGSSSDVSEVSRPDLVETTVVGPTGAIAPGSVFPVTDTVANVGDAYAAASVTRYYLSLDGSRTSDDVRLSGSRSVPGLGANAQSSGSASVTVPSTLGVGTYTLFACADDTSLVSEFDEAGNCRAAATPVRIALSDLVQTSVSRWPAAVSPGTAFTVTDTLTNAGPAGASASTTRYYLSLDALKSGGDILLTGTRSVASLPAGATQSASRTVTVPSSAPPGTYFVLACADNLLRVREADETNNCLASLRSVLVAWPDLVTIAIGTPPPYTTPGSQFAMTDSVMNRGDVAAASSTTRYYLSLDAGRNAGDILLFGSRAVGALAVNGVSSGSRTLSVPATTPHGQYVVLACADDLRTVGESDNANNCAASSSVVVGPPNIRPRADAGRDWDSDVGALVQLDAHGSSDADGDPLTYQWALLARPAGSLAELSDASSPGPTFTMDRPGQYVLRLIVYDGREFSTPDVVTFTTGAERFAALGDTGFGDAGQYAGAEILRTTCERSGCGYVLLLGDNIYQSGVTSVSDEQFTSKFEMPYAGIEVPFHVVLGNHDYGGDGQGNEFDKGPFQVAYSGLSPKWRMPAPYYRFASGEIEFFGLDTNMQMYGEDQQQRADVARWLQESTARWKIALGHHPYRSNGSHGNAGSYNGTSGVPVTSGDGVKSFMEEVVCGRVDLLLSGHDHNLQWLRPNGTCAGTELIVSGAGARPKNLRAGTTAYFQAAQLGVVYLVVTADQLTAEFVGIGGTTLYVRTISKTP